jgi:hypothetical protein
MSQEPKAVVGIFDCNGDRVVIPDDKSDKVQVTIYDREGKPLHVTPVDAREILAGGEYFAVNPVAKAKARAEADALDEAVAKRHARAGASEAGQGGGREKASGGN